MIKLLTLAIGALHWLRAEGHWSIKLSLEIAATSKEEG